MGWLSEWWEYHRCGCGAVLIRSWPKHLMTLRHLGWLAEARRERNWSRR